MNDDLTCPEHGEQHVTGSSVWHTTFACGAYVEDGHWFHAVTFEQKEMASTILEALEDEFSVEDTRYGCCDECDAYNSAMTMRYAPEEVRAEHLLLEATISAYWHFERERERKTREARDAALPEPPMAEWERELLGLEPLAKVIDLDSRRRP